MKVVAILPGYKCEKTLKKFVEEIPKKYFDEIIFIDDHSPDKGFEIAKKIRGIKAYQTSKNLGYGGNLKMCLGTALECGADVIVELHPDGEYRFDGIGPALKEIKNEAKMVLGNRFTNERNALESGMYWWKYPVVWLINRFDNWSLGTEIPDLHQGFRVYTRDLLEKVDFRNNSNNYIFSFQIITQAARAGLKIASVPVSTNYGGEKRGASFRSSLIYTLETFGVLWGKDNYIEKNEEPYPKSYWHWTGVRKIFFEYFQKRRSGWIKEKIAGGSVLDVGCGENLTKLGKKYQVTGIDPFVNKKGIKKVDLLKWKTTKKYDVVVFWESLEHVANPQRYFKKANEVLKTGGLVMIEYPRLNSWEAKAFGKKWYHLDPPRHISNLSDGYVLECSTKSGFKLLKQEPVAAFEYSIWGMVASFFGGGRNLEKRMCGIKMVLLLPWLGLAGVLELGLWLVGQSPIGLYVGKKM